MSADFGPWRSGPNSYGGRTDSRPCLREGYRPHYYITQVPMTGIEVRVEGREIGALAHVQGLPSFEAARETADAIAKAAYGWTLSDEEGKTTT